MAQQIDLESAMADHSVRQEFLDHLLSSPIPGCSGIFYDPGCKLVHDFVYHFSLRIGMNEEQAQNQVNFISRADKYEPYAFVPSVPILAGLVTDMPIFVATGAFSGEVSAEELRHCLVTYEGTHIRQMTTGYPYFSTDRYRESFRRGEIRPIVRRLIDELDAQYHSGMRMGEFTVRQAWVERTQRQVKMLIAGLYNAYTDSISPQEREYIRAMLNVVPHSHTL